MNGEYAAHTHPPLPHPSSEEIEGSTLSELEAQLLLNEGLTAKGKPLLHHQMNEDLRVAYKLANGEAKRNSPITPCFLQRFNAAVMHSTGSVHSVMGGTFDSSQGEFRLCGVTAGVGGRSYVNYTEIPTMTEELCAMLCQRQKDATTLRERSGLSFLAHLNLVSINPWVDGNGRTAHLLMNYMQFRSQLFPTKVISEDHEEYFLSLRQSQDEGKSASFLTFMAQQLMKSLTIEIERFNVSEKKGFTILL